VENPLRHITHKYQQKKETAPKTNDIQAEEESLDTGWHLQANCRGLNHLMFPRHHKDISYITNARAICRGTYFSPPHPCPVKKECLEQALQYPTTDMAGVWAGLTSRQLAAKQQEYGITPTIPTIAQIWATHNKQQDGQQQ
jgi:hypothetical protein